MESQKKVEVKKLQKKIHIRCNDEVGDYDRMKISISS
jgi:hypothetical protein